MKLYVETDMKSYGLTDCGHDYIGAFYSIVVENENGERFRHPRTFDTVEVENIDGFVRFNDIREEVAEEVSDFIGSVKDIDLTKWVKYHTVYGSQAYLEEVPIF